MKFMHSTSIKNFLDILKGSYNKPAGIWNCSRGDDLFYMYDIKEHLEMEGEDSDHVLEMLDGTLAYPEHFVDSWIWHGECQLVLEGEDSFNFNQAVMFEIDIPEDCLHMVEVDTSCPGMTTARTFPTDELCPEWISRVWVRDVSLYDHPFIICGIVHNDLTDLDVDPRVLEFAKLINKSDDMYNLYLDNKFRFENELYSTVQEFKEQYSQYFLKSVA